MPVRPSPPKKVSRRWLQNSALHYLRRYATTSSHLKRIMTRRIDRSLAEHGGDRDEALKQLDEVLDQLQEEGYLNDARYVEARVSDLHRRGSSAAVIRAKLAIKRAPRHLVEEALRSLGDDRADVELEAALAYARRRRLGPFRIDGEALGFERRRKDLASLARAGFSFATARRVIDQGEDCRD